MTKNEKDCDLPALSRPALRAAAVVAALMLGACASDDAATDEAVSTDAVASAPAAEPAPAPASTAFGAPAPRFTVPSAAGQSPPNVNTVPTAAPTPRSTEEERDEARKGLVADLANARHSEQGGRTQPVVVRPYVETVAAPPAAAEPAPSEPLTNRLDTPSPPRPAEAGGAPAKPAAGPAPANKIPSGSE